MDMLTNLHMSGYKSIETLENLQLGPLNVLIGANGAGKSNLISFFKILNWMTPSPGNLQYRISKVGGANALLHDGADTTPEISAHLTFQVKTGVSEYRFRLAHAAPDTLIFAEEQLRFTPHGFEGTREWLSLGAGHREAEIINRANQGDKTARVILAIMRQCIVYQFHNTSETARMRQRWDIHDSRFLRDDAANLAPFLRRLREDQPRYYTRIIETIRQIAPYFADFVLEPIGDTVLLQWREVGSDITFGPHQASDGTLRAIALVALLLQPEVDLPLLLILDEPELGLHPFAINILAGLIESVSTHTQIILATQSMTLINYFQPEQVVVVDRPERHSMFRRLDPRHLRDWLEDYSLAELWEKNILGGKPSL